MRRAWRSGLTVRDTVILDLQVLVGPRTGVWEGIRTSHHHTLCPVVAPAGGRTHEGLISCSHFWGGAVAQRNEGASGSQPEQKQGVGGQWDWDYN